MKRRKLNKKGKLVVFIFILLIVFFVFLIIKPKQKNNDKIVDKKVDKKVTIDNKDEQIDTEEYNLRDGEEIIGKSDKGFLITKLNDVYYIDGILMVNKTYPLPSNYKPSNPYKEIIKDYLYGGDYIEDYVMNAYLKMEEDAKKEGISLKITSGYRSYSVQEELYDSYVKKDGEYAADTYSARPGHSEHQSGLCFDLNGTNKNFIKTKEGKWLNDNCYKYGFTLRFPEGKTEFTGYMYEGWHFRYVGVELATILYNNGDWISLEEYYGITSKYEN